MSSMTTRLLGVLGILLLTTLHDAPKAIAEPSKPFLREIRFEQALPGEETVLISVRDFSRPKLSALQGSEPRVVCDFLDAGLARTVNTRQTVDGSYIKRIRVGVHGNPTKIRVVLDLDPQHDYDVRQGYAVDDEVFFVVVTPSNPEGNAAKHDPSRSMP
jgi:hypothetical protein